MRSGAQTSVSVRVPASTANLGSGYDAFGLALARYNFVSAELVSDADGWAIAVAGEGAGEISTGGDNLVVTTMRRLFMLAGKRDVSARIVCENGIPLGRGLGSSSAAIAGGLVAANELVGRPMRDEELFRMAAEIEGHPDNVAAALAGGFTICWSQDGETKFAQVDPPGGIAAVIVVSDAPLSTKASRELLPRNVPHVDAAFDAGRAGLLATGIVLGRGDLVGPGMNDRLHEPYRAAAVTDLDEVREALLAAGADGAALSGAGPTVIGLVTAADDATALERAAGVAAKTTRLLEGHAGRKPPEVVGLDREGTVLA